MRVKYLCRHLCDFFIAKPTSRPLPVLSHCFYFCSSLPFILVSTENPSPSLQLLAPICYLEAAAVATTAGNSFQRNAAVILFSLSPTPYVSAAAACWSVLSTFRVTHSKTQSQPLNLTFYRTQVNLGSDLWVRMSVTKSMMFLKLN